MTAPRECPHQSLTDICPACLATSPQRFALADAGLAYARSIKRTIVAYSEADVAIAYIEGHKAGSATVTP